MIINGYYPIMLFDITSLIFPKKSAIVYPFNYGNLGHSSENLNVADDIAIRLIRPIRRDLEDQNQRLAEPSINNVPKVVKSKELKKLKKFQKKELPNLGIQFDKEESCSICLIKFDEDSNRKHYMMLPCKHVFHYSCIYKYLKRYSCRCPLCNKSCGNLKTKT